jgi:hypothetical protein
MAKDEVCISRYIHRAFLYNSLTHTNKCTKTSLSLISLLKGYPHTHFDTSILPSSGGSLEFVHRPMFLSYI